MSVTIAPKSDEIVSAPDEAESSQLAAIIAEFPTAGSVLSAAHQMRAEGWTDWDVHSPFPIHGIDEAIGIRATRLPWITLTAGFAGIVVGLGMQWWMNAIDYPFLISGKPLFALPAAIPVIFELMILFAAISTIAGMLILNGLPRLSNPLFDSDLFLRATSDRFFICISAKDPKFDRETVLRCFDDCHATATDECFLPAPRDYYLPKLLPVTMLFVGLFGLIPIVLIAQKRSTTTTEPRFHAIFDMDFQPKFKPQRTSTLFADGRAMRPQPTGTVARNDLKADSRMFKGLEPGVQGSRALALLKSPPKLGDVTQFASATASQVDGSGKLVSMADPPPDPLDSLPWVTTFPIDVTPKMMKRGQERFNIYCAVCHGLGGDGDGLVTRRALELEQGTWIKPTSFHTENVRGQPIGRIFHSITNGVRKMPAYGDAITAEDRWAIILYMQALQQSRRSELKEVPAELVPQLRDMPNE